MEIYSKASGPQNCRPLVLIHGWALNSRVWDNLVTQMSPTQRLICIDLPGHGKSPLPHNSAYTLADISAAVGRHLQTLTDEPVDVLGWSLGGMCAAQLAYDQPAMVRKLVLLSSSPQFVRSPQWPHAVEASVLDNFATELMRDYRNTIMRFLAIQALGSSAARDQIRQLREKIFVNGEPRQAALEGGLEILRSQRLQTVYQQLRCPTQLILGEKDTLIPSRSAGHSQDLLANCRLDVIAGAGHALFMSHPQQFVTALTEFLDNHQ